MKIENIEKANQLTKDLFMLEEKLTALSKDDLITVVIFNYKEIGYIICKDDSLINKTKEMLLNHIREEITLIRKQIEEL